MKHVKKIAVVHKVKKPRRIPVHTVSRTVIQSRKMVRMFLTLQKQVFVFGVAFLVVLTNARGFMAFEAHVVNVRAEIARIDPPTVSPAGDTYEEPVEVSITNDDTDATHIFYTVTPGSDGDAAPDPICGGGNGEWGGIKPLPSFLVSENSVIKAIACAGGGTEAPGSFIVSHVYTFLTNSPSIFGHKYHDVNQDGIFDDGFDFPLEGWKIFLLDADDVVASTTVTDANGFYIFRGVPFGVYTVKEESRDGWTHVTPKDFPASIDQNNKHQKFDFYNFDSGFMCVPKDIMFEPGLAVQVAGSSSENDDVALASHVTINGDVRSNDEIEIIGGSDNRIIEGSATSTNSIDAGISITKMTLTGAPAITLPDVMIAEWKDRAADGGIVNGSFIFPDGTLGLQMGPSEISGNVTFGSSNTVTVKGPLYIHGNLSIGSGSTITQDAAFGDQFIPIVVDGLIDIDSDVSFNGSGVKGAFLLISTHAAVSGNDAAIEIASGNSDLGDAVLYASDGDVHVRSDNTILATFAAHGTGDDADDNAAIRLDSNVTVNYRELPDKISCGPRQAFDSTLHIVINEFMPNPVGDDNAVKPEGEWVELFNPTSVLVNVDGWVLYDSSNSNELVISATNTDTGDTILPSKGFLVVYRNGDGDFALNNSSGDSVRLFDGAIGSGGALIDSHAYAISVPENKSFARVPDGSSNWIDPDPTPGHPNMFFFEVLEGVAEAFIPGVEEIIVEEEPVDLGLTDTMIDGVPVSTPEDIDESTPLTTGEESSEDSASTPVDEPAETSEADPLIDASASSETPVSETDTAADTDTDTKADVETIEDTTIALPEEATNTVPETSTDDGAGDEDESTDE
ncbi:MAG: hypothetical protein A3J54_00340 [Candidatus Ryanbacteria bacterium RIFCSPHIGHO2_02_FULL_45_13b]|uniref:LTD domain-containing protein n=1 Tax=Candidatus Ryanbacteria bacterium RIFCSPHIGHO2_02_FULL_45_13b TaxID=1802117 RepID=A0A1G2G4J1_9BACT|nr:MAG: hypothetical protein A3J54_00340 [Candidatus Ryanbacteria bacterium RIFCSPHIGHO2_02_FULL_45_13b]